MRQARPDVRLWTGVSAIAVAALLLIEFLVRAIMGPAPNSMTST